MRDLYEKRMSTNYKINGIEVTDAYGIPPLGNEGCQMVVGGEKGFPIFYVFGGFGSGISPDLYCYDLRDHSWAKKSLEMVTGAGKPPRLYSHSSVFHDGLIFNFGG